MQKVLEDFPGYIIHSDGKVYSKKHKRFVKTFLNHKGYVYVKITNKEYKTKGMYLHRLVALAFIENPNNLPQINHKDDNKLNNDISNLEWCTPEYNMNYGKRKNCKSKPVAQIDPNTNEIISEYISAISAAKALGIEQGGISMVARGQGKTYKGFAWKYI